MGKSNRARRAAKHRAEQHGRRRNEPGSAGGPSAGSGPSASAPPPSVLVEQLWTAARALRRPSPAGAHALAAVTGDPARFEPVVRQQLTLLVARLWDHGWLPYDVVRYAHRRCEVEAAAAFGHLAGVQAQRACDEQAVDRRWAASAAAAVAFLDQLDTPGPCSIVQWIELLAFVADLPPLAVLVPPPGASGTRINGGSAATATDSADARQLERVRALLAKAESTTFPEEAEALTAKAQELIARHSLDQALRAGPTHSGARPQSIRIWLDDPYADAKSFLVAGVARANRCSSVWDSGLGCTTVFGFAHDLDAVELLYASLLAQATGAMARHGAVRDQSGRSRTRSFRRAFLLGFAQRIGQRLREASAGQERDVTEESGGALLPVLASRLVLVEEAQQAAFPRLTFRRPTSVTNGEGWRAGKIAADLARLGPDSAQLRTG